MFGAVQNSISGLVLRAILAVYIVFSFGTESIGAGEKRILLRNETIVTGTPKRQSLRAQSAEPAAGLYLLQLEDGYPADFQEELTALNVEFLRPIPQDAFVVHLHNADLQSLRSLPYVRWVGKYRTEHKTHPLVQQLAMVGDQTRARISVLLSPKASPIDVARLQRAFALLTRYSRTGFGRVLEGSISPKGLEFVKQSAAVLWVEPAPKMELFDAVALEIFAGEGEDLRPAIHDLGFDGDGVTVAVADSGLDFGEADSVHPDLAGRVDAFFHYGELLDASDEHSHGTHVTGIVAGDGALSETDEFGYLYGLGIAPKSHIVVQRLFDGLGGYHAPSSFAELTSNAVRAGADIGSNSWGDDTQGRYDTSAMEFDALVRDADPDTPGDQQYILEFSAGNAGPGDQTIGSPAVAKNVIATGASQNNRFDFFIYADGQETMADFSSRGPTEDGRIKPDLVAPGTWIASLQSGAATDEFAWGGISPSYQYQGGTSQAGPQVSGAAAVFVQYYRELNNGVTPSPALVKAALINSAVDMDNSIHPGSGGTGFTPNMAEGWGRVELTELIGSERGYDFTDQTHPITSGQVFEKPLVVASDLMPLKITLAYTDVPGFPPAIPALVNDLDLEVISPSGVIYRGNQFLDGESVPNAAGHDLINNVEGVHVTFPEPGEYLIRIAARRVLEDSRRDTGPVDQDFALVFSGDVPFPGHGVLSMNRRAYNVPATIELKLIDFDLAGQPAASVMLESDSQATPLTVELQASGTTGVFTGAVQTATISAPGQLRIAHGDTIRAFYQDLSPERVAEAIARGDIVSPLITETSATNRFGRETIRWRTDELARGTLFYGTNGTFTAVGNSIYRTEHEITVGNLVEGQTYQFYIVAEDQAGNLRTNDNNGSFHSFVGKPAASVLLVDAYNRHPDSDSIEIPVTSYTDALDRTGVSYEVWDVDVEGSPNVENLKPFRVVMWRINDSFWDEANNITLGQQTVITEYLNGGGAFFLSSMQALTRLGESAFVTNVLQVGAMNRYPPGALECPECDEDQGAAFIEGIPLEPVSSGISLELDYSQYPVLELEPIFENLGPDLSDIFTPTTNAAPILVQESGGVVGVKYPKAGSDAPGRVVFLSFPLDAVPLDGPAPNNRANLLRNLLLFLAPGLDGLGSVTLDSTSYTVPASATVEVADSDLIGAASVTVECRATPGGASTTLMLTPAVRPGTFRGMLTLVPTNEPVAPGRLPVEHGNFIEVEYLDETANGNVQVRAEIDEIIPEISNIEVETDYVLAFISWETSEPSDSLIQFGESTFLSKTAYDPGPSTVHSLMLPALLPDHVYYYQVVSRDPAGNTVIDNNNGKLYTFRTLKPLSAPWYDNLETGATEWSVQVVESSEAGWRIGEPNNGYMSQAHSPANAWGTNLDGDSTSLVETYLISPAIDLTGGNSATVKFWHNYDFLSVDALQEIGTVMLVTNSQTQPITLKTYGEYTDGWEQEQVDLTPYLGHVVHLVWGYAMIDFSFENNVHPGWLVDDIELTVTNLLKGSILVTNNVSAAGFQVGGPSSFEGSGRGLIRTNMVTGEYTITFTDVPYYTTPPPETALLEENATLVFQGNYTLVDANTNDISDAWETEWFGEVSPSRTRKTDTDEDGMSDFAEFTAGTDPLAAGSRLAMYTIEVLPDNRVRLTWPSTAGKMYQLLASWDGVEWTPYSTPMRASEALTAFTLAAPQGQRSYLFKIEVLP